MAKLDRLGSVLEFLRGLSPKISNQIAKKVLALNIDPRPNDSENLKGYPDFYRIDSSEYRIIYRFTPEEDLVEIVLVGKRNDDEVYEQFKCLMG
jgi:mRNA interferase RelE/StbE